MKKEKERKKKIEEKKVKEKVVEDDIIEDEIIEEENNEKKTFKKEKIIILLIVLLTIIILAVVSLVVINKNIKLTIKKTNETIEVFSDFKLEEGSAKIFKHKLKVKKTGTIDNSKVGTYKITYKTKFFIFKKEIIKKVKVVDTTKPEITMRGQQEKIIYIGDTYNDEGATATDKYDGDITDKIEITNNIDSSKAGDYEITYKIKDSSNNEAEVKRTIHVVEKPASGPAYINSNGVIYLTFDDGPGDTTPRLLDILAKYKAKATFFVTCKGSDDVIKRAYNEGHTIGLHTCSHDYAIYSSLDTYYNDLNQVENRVFNITGIHSKLIRFPGGSSNTVSRKYSSGIMSTLVNDVQNKGYQYYDWNVSSGDAGSTTNPDVIAANVENGVSPTKTNIVLMHDIHTYSVDAVEPILQWGQANGYRFEALSINVKPSHHGVNN